jgi:hypothetical protein
MEPFETVPKLQASSSKVHIKHLPSALGHHSSVGESHFALNSVLKAVSSSMLVMIASGQLAS